MQKDKESWDFFDIWQSKHFFTVMLSWRRETRKPKKKESRIVRESTSSPRKLPSALLHHGRSASPTSSPGCSPLDTLNWIPVRCAALPWVSFLRVTEHWAVHMCMCACVCVFHASVCVCVCGGGGRQPGFPNKELPTLRVRCQQTNTCAHTQTHTI